MRTFLVGISLLLFAGSAWAADIAWDYDPTHENATGYRLVFNDGTTEHNKTFPTSEVVVSGDVCSWGPIEEKLNLHPGIAYTFMLAQYNDTGEAGLSEPVSWERPAYVPPPDKLPEPVLSPGQPNNLRIE